MSNHKKITCMICFETMRKLSDWNTTFWSDCYRCDNNLCKMAYAAKRTETRIREYFYYNQWDPNRQQFDNDYRHSVSLYDLVTGIGGISWKDYEDTF